MFNELFLLIKKSRISIIELAKQSGISRNRIGQLIATDELTEDVKISTLRQIVKPLGYQIKIEFIPKTPNHDQGE